MTDDTRKRIDRAKELDAVACNGPWRQCCATANGTGCAGAMVWDDSDQESPVAKSGPEHVNARNNMAFVAESRTLLPALASNLETALERAEKAERERDGMLTCFRSLLELHRLREQGQVDGAADDEVRERTDKPWYAMPGEAGELWGAISEELMRGQDAKNKALERLSRIDSAALPEKIAAIQAQLDTWENLDPDDDEKRDCAACRATLAAPDPPDERAPLCAGCHWRAFRALFDAVRAQAGEIEKLRFGLCSGGETCGHCRIEQLTEQVDRLENERDDARGRIEQLTRYDPGTRSGEGWNFKDPDGEWINRADVLALFDAREGGEEKGRESKADPTIEQRIASAREEVSQAAVTLAQKKCAGALYDCEEEALDLAMEHLQELLAEQAEAMAAHRDTKPDKENV
jgi:hypothetical protein